jgi:hypothetical protein
VPCTCVKPDNPTLVTNCMISLTVVAAAGPAIAYGKAMYAGFSDSGPEEVEATAEDEPTASAKPEAEPG